MNRNSKFITAAVAAAVTFGSLMLLVGPQHFGYIGKHRYHGGHHMRHHGDCDHRQQSNQAPDVPPAQDSL